MKTFHFAFVLLPTEVQCSPAITSLLFAESQANVADGKLVFHVFWRLIMLFVHCLLLLPWCCAFSEVRACVWLKFTVPRWTPRVVLWALFMRRVVQWKVRSMHTCWSTACTPYHSVHDRSTTYNMPHEQCDQECWKIRCTIFCIC